MNISRQDVGRRMSQIVVHNGIVYLAGQVDDGAGPGVEAQTRAALARIDQLLARAGTDNSRLLAATVWLTDMRHYDAMNGIWNAWLPDGQAPARACVEARLAGSQYLVEIMVTAALP